MSNSVKPMLRLALFDHLLSNRKPGADHSHTESIRADRFLDPATIKLGALYKKGIIQSDDDRLTSLYCAFSNIIRDYTTPPKKIFREDFDKFISKQVQHLVDCRQLSKGMGNLIKYLRHCISCIAPDASQADAKSYLTGKMQSFLDERVIYAWESITGYVLSTLRDVKEGKEEVILTFGSSPLVRKVLQSAVEKGKKFRLVVVDTRPLNEGLETLSQFSSSSSNEAMGGVECVYCPLSGAYSAMTQEGVTKVILGASCMMSNGAMLAPAGTAMVASLAKAQQIPVIVVSESYKFSDKVQLDSIVFNELGSIREIAVMALSDTGDFVPSPQQQTGYLGALAAGVNGGPDAKQQAQQPKEQKQQTQQQTQAHPARDPPAAPSQYLSATFSPSLITTQPITPPLPFNVLNLRYDLTPIHNISVVATETGLIPPTSIPVLIREMQQQVPQSR